MTGMVEIAKATGRFGWTGFRAVDFLRPEYVAIFEEMQERGLHRAIDMIGATGYKTPARIRLAESLCEETRFWVVPRLSTYDRDLIRSYATIPQELMWHEPIVNVVTDQGVRKILDEAFAGSGYTAAWYMGLVDNAGWTAYAAADTAAQINGTNGWDEFVNYSQATRPSMSWAAASSRSKATSAASVFSINGAGGVVRGLFVVSANTKGGTTGQLYSAGDSAEGNKSVSNGDTINGTYTTTLT